MFHIFSRLIRSAIIFLFHIYGNLILCGKNYCYTHGDFKNACVVLRYLDKDELCVKPGIRKGNYFLLYLHVYLVPGQFHCTCILWFSHYSQECTSSAILKQQFLFFCFVISIVWDHSHFCKDLHIKAKTLCAYGSSKLLFVLNF